MKTNLKKVIINLIADIGKKQRTANRSIHKKVKMCQCNMKYSSTGKNKLITSPYLNIRNDKEPLKFS